MAKLDELEKADVPRPVSGSNSSSVHVPTIWIMFLVVPLFVGAIAIQGVELAKRLRDREAFVDNAASMREFQRARSAYEEQVSEWQKLAESSKTQMATAQSQVAQLEAKIKLLTEAAGSQASVAEEAKQKIATLNADILTKRTELSGVEAEIQVTQSRKQAIEKVNIDLQKDYAAKKAEVDQLGKKLSTLVGDVASNTARIKAQLEEIKANDLAKIELVREKGELAGVKQEKTTVSDILTALKVEADRLTEDRGKRMAELESLNSQIGLKQEELRKLIKERDSLAGEVADLKSNRDVAEENATNSNKPEDRE
jgi:predicted  nucleic acid-binding Zn-ribbon protein